MVFRALKKIISPILGKKRFQRFFEKLNKLSLLGMNIGNGGDLKKSGEMYALNYIKEVLGHKDELTIFDVGANIGDYSLMLSKIFGSRASIYSFEPAHETYLKLKENVSASKNITAYNFGFGDSEAEITLYSNSKLSGLASIYKRRLDHFNISMSYSERIGIKKLDSFCKNNNIDNIDFLKLDVEGHELKVLEGASRMLREGKVKFIQFEFGGCNIDSRTYFQDFYYLLKDNYKIHRVLKNGLHPINKYKEIYESFTTTNFLAEKR